jgi:hypothetical protein
MAREVVYNEWLSAPFRPLPVNEMTKPEFPRFEVFEKRVQLPRAAAMRTESS